ncbi:hypothetical protein D9M73_196430 [compost metagenome]
MIFQFELDQGGWLLGIVDLGTHRVRMPAKRKQPLRLDPLDQHVPQYVFITGVRNPALGPLACHKTLAFQRHAKPLSEHFGIGQHAPDLRTLGLEQDFPFDAIRCWVHKSPPVLEQ